MRAAKAFGPTMPSVTAATAGAKIDAAAAASDCVAATSSKLWISGSARQAAVTAIAAATISARLALVRSISAPAGVCAAMPASAAAGIPGPTEPPPPPRATGEKKVRAATPRATPLSFLKQNLRAGRWFNGAQRGGFHLWVGAAERLFVGAVVFSRPNGLTAASAPSNFPAKSGTGNAGDFEAGCRRGGDRGSVGAGGRGAALHQRADRRHLRRLLSARGCDRKNLRRRDTR